MPEGRVVSFLLHLRYVAGHLAAGFLVAVPAQLILRREDAYLVHSLAYGIVCLLAFLLLLPLSRFDWRSVTVPEFIHFERAVAFYAALLAGGLLVASLFAPPLEKIYTVFWIVFLVNFFNWANKKVNTYFFAARKPKRIEEPPFDGTGPTMTEGDTKILFRPGEKN